MISYRRSCQLCLQPLRLFRKTEVQIKITSSQFFVNGTSLKLQPKCDRDARFFHNGCYRLVALQLKVNFSTANPNVINNNITHPTDTQRNSEFIRCHPAYKDLFYHPENPVVISHPLVKRFVDLSLSSPDAFVTDPKYSDHVSPLLSSLSEISDEDLIQVLFHVSKFPRVKSHKESAYHQLWKQIDEESIQRGVKRHNWKHPINFVMAHLWCNLGLGSRSTFNWIFEKNCLRKVDTLSQEEFVRLCMCLSQIQSIPESISLYNMEYNIPRFIMNQDPSRRLITTQELAAICGLFLKLKICFHGKTIANKILTIAAEGSKSIASASVVSISLGICMSNRLSVHEGAEVFLKAMGPEIYRLDIGACAALLHLSRQTRVKNEIVLNSVIEKLNGELEYARIQHVESITGALGQFYDSHPVYERILKHITDIGNTLEEGIQMENSGNSMSDKSKQLMDNNTKMLGRNMVKILDNLASANLYPEALVSLVLSPEFLKVIFGKSMYEYPPEVVFLEQNVLADVKNYQGPHLSDKTRSFMLKKNMEWFAPPEKERVARRQTFYRNVQKTLTEIFGDPESVFICNILPHHKTIEAVFCTNGEGELTQIPESFKSKPAFEPKLLTQDDLAQVRIKYHAVLLHCWEMLLSNSNEPVGKGRTLRRQIKNMGFTTHVVTLFKWDGLLTDEEKQKYFGTLLDGYVKISSKTLTK